MEAGKLCHRVEIQNKITPRDPVTGDFLAPAWVEFAKVWAAVEDLSARDMIAAKAGQSQVTGRMVIRYRAGVLPTMRVIHRGETYSIEGPPLADKKSGLEYLTLLVSKGVKDG
ncbi:phage head-tail adaptor, putative, SPP1 family [Pseudomonas synxantha]|uniref:Phage head-tail adaptor n=1 Tax=Pseudomonas synxantha TaxID=47883 RepID=A0AAX3I482_9PSED|nr:phage head closure protein [Pseudomonas synxantha]KRP50239.1 head-tail adaptor protein [Pseudomonas synxantha]SDU69137.1 phage head-tail adaptor, putative, SPP1 family [Pseudomonas synxantha]VTQ88191.1 phage head-tail adaptor [Pseudomonas synxantha]